MGRAAYDARHVLADASRRTGCAYSEALTRQDLTKCTSKYSLLHSLPSFPPFPLSPPSSPWPPSSRPSSSSWRPKTPTNPVICISIHLGGS